MGNPSFDYLPSPEHLQSGPAAPQLPEFVAATAVPSSDPQPRRQHYRAPAEACLPVGFQLLDAAGAPVSGWCKADVLDVSVAGFCLLLVADLPFQTGEKNKVYLDVRKHPSFGVDALMGEIRWFTRSMMVTTVGISFDRQLSVLPKLQMPVGSSRDQGESALAA